MRAKGLQERGHNVFIVSPVPADHLDLPIILPRVTQDSAARTGVAQMVLSLVFILLRLRPDVFFAHYAAEYVCWLAALLFRRPLVINAMGSDVLLEATGQRGWFRGFLTRFALRSAALITSKSPHVSHTMRNLKIPQNVIESVIWGVDLGKMQHDPEGRTAWRKKWGCQDDDFVVLSPRPLERLYQQHLLVQAMPELLRKVPNAKAVISDFRADPPYRKVIEQIIVDLHLEDRVRFVEHQPAERMPALISASDAVVSLALSDGTSQSVLETLACNTPVVVADIPDVRETFTDQKDCLFAVGEPIDIAEKLTRIATNATIRHALEAGGKQLVERHANFPKEVERVETLLFKIVDESRQRRRRF